MCLENGPHSIEISFSSGTNLDIFHCVTCWMYRKRKILPKDSGARLRIP
jgi:hypothetical protein